MQDQAIKAHDYQVLAKQEEGAARLRVQELEDLVEGEVKREAALQAKYGELSAGVEAERFVPHAHAPLQPEPGPGSLTDSHHFSDSQIKDLKSLDLGLCF